MCLSGSVLHTESFNFNFSLSGLSYIFRSFVKLSIQTGITPSSSITGVEIFLYITTLRASERPRGLNLALGHTFFTPVLKVKTVS